MIISGFNRTKRVDARRPPINRPTRLAPSPHPYTRKTLRLVERSARVTQRNRSKAANAT